MTVTVYTTENCPQCYATQRQLNLRDIPFTPVDLTENQEAYQYVTTELGYNQAPVVVVRQDEEIVTHWSGFRPDRLKETFSL